MFAIPAEASSTPEQREEIAAVADCVARLNEHLGQLIRLRYVCGMTTRGIAAEMHMPESTVRSCLGEALDCIERCLQGKGIVLTDGFKVAMRRATGTHVVLGMDFKEAQIGMVVEDIPVVHGLEPDPGQGRDRV